MARPSKRASLLMLFLVCTSSLMFEPAQARPSSRGTRARSRAYIVAACRQARYPALCYQCLSRQLARSGVVTPHELAQAALAAALYRAVHTRRYIMNVSRELEAVTPRARDYQQVKDCISQMTSGIYQMSHSIAELRRLQAQAGPVVGNDFYFHISDIETWVSATITDAMMCIEEFPGRRMGKVRATIKGKVLNVAMTASNALYFFHSFAAKYGAAKGLHRP